MITCSEDHTEQITAIASGLASKYLKPLYKFSNEKNYYVYIGSLCEIISWSNEFHAEYYYKLKDWNSFEQSSDNIYNAISEDDFLIAWGGKRIKRFFEQHATIKTKTLYAEKSLIQLQQG